MSKIRSEDHIGRRLRFRDLQVFSAVAQSGSMAKAAAQLGVTQPAVSEIVAGLERMFDVRLFDRSPRGVELTSYGSVLLKRGVAVFDELKQSIQDIEYLADPTTGELRVGAAEPMLAGLLPAIIEHIHLKHPMISVQVRPLGAVAQIHRDLRERDVDLILSRMPQSPEEDLDNEILFYDRTLVVAGLNNASTRRRKIKLAELIDQPWILPPPDTVIGALIEGAFRTNGLDVPRRNVMTSSMQLHGALLVRGPYLSIFPSSTLHFSAERMALKTLPVDLGIPPWPIALTTLKNRTISPVAQLFIESAREVSKPLARQK